MVDFDTKLKIDAADELCDPFSDYIRVQVPVTHLEDAREYISGVLMRVVAEVSYIDGETALILFTNKQPHDIKEEDLPF